MVTLTTLFYECLVALVLFFVLVQSVTSYLHAPPFVSFLVMVRVKRVIVVMILLLKSYIFLVMSSSLNILFSSLFLPSVISCQSLILSALTLSLMILLTLYPLLAHPYHIMFPLLSLTYLLQATTNNATRDIFYAPPSQMMPLCLLF